MEKGKDCTFLYSSKVLQRTGQRNTSGNADHTIVGPPLEAVLSWHRRPPVRLPIGEGPPIHQHISHGVPNFGGIFSPAAATKPSQSVSNSGTYGAVFLASLILCHTRCRLVRQAYTHTCANSHYLFNTHMCIHSCLDLTRLTSCRGPPRSAGAQGRVQLERLGQGVSLTCKETCRLIKQSGKRVSYRHLKARAGPHSLIV